MVDSSSMDLDKFLHRQDGFSGVWIVVGFKGFGWFGFS